MGRSDLVRSGFLFLAILVDMIFSLTSRPEWNNPDTLPLYFQDEP